MTVSKYLAIPLIFGLTSCSLTKNMVFVNGPKDLEYKINCSALTTESIQNAQNRMANANYFEKKPIPYYQLGNVNDSYVPGILLHVPK